MDIHPWRNSNHRSQLRCHRNTFLPQYLFRPLITSSPRSLTTTEERLRTSSNHFLGSSIMAMGRFCGRSRNWLLLVVNMLRKMPGRILTTFCQALRRMWRALVQCRIVADVVLSLVGETNRFLVLAQLKCYRGIGCVARISVGF